MKPDQYENNAEGILCVYKNPKWLVCIKNWKPDNDIAGIAHLEVHHSTDEQFILAAGKAILITAEREGGSFIDSGAGGWKSWKNQGIVFHFR